MKRWNLALVLVLAIVVLAACAAPQKNTASPEKTGNDKLQVITTYSILYDIVKNVGGDRVEIHSLAPIGSNPHEYDPLPVDVKKTTDADAVFYNGLNLEAGNSWFPNLMRTAGKSGKDAPVFCLSVGVAAKHLTTKGKESEEDPHAWLDVRNGIKYVENARDALIKIDPAHKETYEKNAKTYIEKLNTLHENAVKQLKMIPKEQRVLVTSEGAFKYFSEAYDFQAGYIWEINSENQGTPDQVSAIVDLIRAQKIPALFLETSIDPRSMEMVSRETGVPIVGKVFTDSLGKPGEDGDTYIQMMEWNIKTIYEGLMKKK
ncbi:iron/zinc/copper transport system substrate-binding protein [Paenibacillus tianmuensis]|uniref:Iron/zinc/copper transport system substrate-binding protein n=1 Tax=Paenibacillus tianmuensis TaxID=624147 RepID=A0A1G4RFX1_9BACL|nr:metal ABC transporter substrate-binding protein [Paenibacillus tianmuensis]SCW55531.1 iron/zinc/copper transport system substrate-binding protein [Paenibacillus tianmuensis]